MFRQRLLELKENLYPFFIILSVICHFVAEHPYNEDDKEEEEECTTCGSGIQKNEEKEQWDKENNQKRELKYKLIKQQGEEEKIIQRELVEEQE